MALIGSHNIRTLVLTGYDAAFAPVAAITVPRMKAYAERHGCEFRAVISKHGKDMFVTKIAPLRVALEEAFDLIIWLDADALVLRLDQFISDAMPDHADFGLVWHPFDGESSAHYNVGVMVVRNTLWSKAFFAKVDTDRYPKHVWPEQAVILHHLGYDRVIGLGPDRPDAPDRAHTASLDGAWNAIPAIATVPDPIIHHWAGIYSDARVRAIEADAALNPWRDIADSLTHQAIASHMNRWYTEACKIANLVRQLRSPRLLMKQMPGLLKSKLVQALVPKSLRQKRLAHL